MSTFRDCSILLMANIHASSLAYAELYLVLAMLVRRYDMELYETTLKNVKFERDFGTPYPDEGNFNVRVRVTNVLTE